MNDLLKYREFLGSVHFNARDEVFYGQVEGIDDLITFEGRDVNELKQDFQSAVDDYLAVCAAHHKTAGKSYKGIFKVRVTPALHQKAEMSARELGISLSRFIQQAVEDKLHQLAEVPV